MENKIENQKNKVLISATGVNLLSGIIYMWSIISKSLTEDLHWTSSQASLPYTTFTVSFVIAMVLFGKVQDTKGPRLVVTLGSILMGLGIILSGIFVTPKVLVLTIGVISGGGVGMMTVASSPPVVKWFPPSKKGLVTGIVVAGAGLSAVLYSPIASYFIVRFGLNKTFLIIGSFVITAATLTAQGLKNPPEGYDNGADQRVDSVGEDYTWQEMLKELEFYKLWILLAFASSSGLMIIGHISTIADIQTGWQAGFILVILISIFNTLGRLSGGFISDKIGRINLIRIALVLQGINMLLFAGYSTKLTLGMGVAIAGFCYGSNFSVFPATVSDLYGMKNFGINYGLIFTGWGLGGIIGPMVAANIFDKTNNYNGAYTTALVLLVISLLITFTMKNRKG